MYAALFGFLARNGVWIPNSVFATCFAVSSQVEPLRTRLIKLRNFPLFRESGAYLGNSREFALECSKFRRFRRPHSCNRFAHLSSLTPRRRRRKVSREAFMAAESGNIPRDSDGHQDYTEQSRCVVLTLFVSSVTAELVLSTRGRIGCHELRDSPRRLIIICKRFIGHSRI